MPNPPRSRGRQVNVYQALALLLSFVLVAGVGGVLAAGLVLPGVAAANGVTDVSIEAFDGLPTALEQTALPEKSTILAADGTLLATFFHENRVVVPLTDISVQIQHAVVAIEDRRFYEHAGIDPQGMLRALVQNLAHKSQQGASTLTQQYVKNELILAAQTKGTEAQQQAAVNAAKEHEGTEGYARKLREAKLAITVEKTMTKDQILEKYLNIAQFGASVYGVESAAQYYFGKSAKDVSYLEAATIAGITQSPTKWDPILNPEASEKRRNLVLLNMAKQGYITRAEYHAGVTTPLPSTLDPHPLKQGCMAAGERVAGSGYFCDYVTKVMVNDPAFGATDQERKDLLYKGGLTITTTLDPRLQTIADTEVKNGIPVDDPEGVGSSIVTVQPGTGQILTMAQNRNYTAVQEHGERDEPVNFNTDFAYGASGGFAPGSTFKPFTLLEWLKQGHSLSEFVDGTARTLNENQFTRCGAKGPNVPWPVGNAEPGSGQMSVLDATKNSVNLAYLSMAMKLDLCNIMDGATALGVHTAKGAAPTSNPANVIGTDSVAPLTMAAAFATFASGGSYCTPVAILSVVDAAGQPLPIPQANCHQAIEPRYANTINYALSNVWKGTASSVGAPPFPSAGKTGTTTGNEQTWFVGYTPKLATAVWVGDPKQSKRRIVNMWIAGKYVKWAYGSTIAAPTWKRFTVQALEGGDNPGFADADDKLVFGEKVAVPSVIGKTVPDATAVLKEAGFAVKVDDAQVPAFVPAGQVAEQDPSGKATRGSVVTLRLSNGQPPAGPPPGQQGQQGQPGFPWNGGQGGIIPGPGGGNGGGNNGGGNNGGGNNGGNGR